MVDKSTELDILLTKGIDTKNRRIYFGAIDDGDNEFNWKTVELTIRAIHKMLSEYPKKPIEIHISSPGGESYEMHRLVDVIQDSSAKIIFIGGGEIASSAAFLMVACDERILYPNTSIMLHDITECSEEGSSVTATERKIEGAETDRHQEQIYRLLEDNSRMPFEFWKEVLSRDLYLTPTEAIMLGIADKIIEPKKRGNLRKSRNYGLEHGPDKKSLSKLVKDLFKRVHKGKNINKIEVHTPEEQFDDDLVIDDAPVPIEAAKDLSEKIET